MERLGTALLAIERWTRAPPPLNLPWTLAAFCKSVYKWCRNGRQPASEDYALDDIAKEKLSEMKMRKALTVESLVLKMHRQNDERIDSAVPDIVKDIAFDVDVLGDKADNLMAELKDMKDVIPVARFSRRRSTVTSRLSIEAVSRSNLRRLRASTTKRQKTRDRQRSMLRMLRHGNTRRSWLSIRARWSVSSRP